MPTFSLFSPGYDRTSRPRWQGLALSVILHACVLATAPFWNATLWELDKILSESVNEAIEANEKNRRLVWYRVTPLPPVRNSSENTTRKTARGRVYSKDEIVADQTNATSSQQLVYQAEARRQLETDTSLANALAQSPSSEAASTPAKQRKVAPLPADSPRQTPTPNTPTEQPPSLAASASPLSAMAQSEIARLPKPPPKKFVSPQSPEARTTPARYADFGALPQLDSQDSPLNTSANAAVPSLPKPAPRKFVAPGASANATQRAGAADFGNAPEVGLATATLNGNPAGMERLPKLPPKRFQPPQGSGSGQLGAANGTAQRRQDLEAPPTIGDNAGTGLQGIAKTDIAVLSQNPGSALPPPQSSLSGRFSQAKEVGEPAHVANNNPRAASLPGVSTNPDASRIQDLRLATPEQILGKEAAEGYFEIRLDLKRQWPRLSAPLAPNSRMLPRRIEPYFRSRSVFAIVIPIEKLDRYGGDWIVWFSPKNIEGVNPVLSPNVKMETPLPIWKLESKRWLVAGPEQATEHRVQVLVEITKEGRIVVRDLINRMSPALNQLVVNDLSRWVFQPAKRDGQAINVDAVMEIPFRLPSTVQLSAQ